MQYGASGTDPSVKYAGQWDEASGLYYDHARYYDPTLGRFVSADPVLGHLGAPQTQDRYAYAVNNPERFEDPSGRDIWSSIAGVFGGVNNAMMSYSYWWVGASWAQRGAMFLAAGTNMLIGIGAGGLQNGSWICGAVGETGCASDLAAHANAAMGWGTNSAYNYFLGWTGGAPDPRGSAVARTWAPVDQIAGPLVLGVGLTGITDVADVADAADTADVADLPSSAEGADSSVPMAAQFPEGLQDGSQLPFSRVPQIVRAYLGDDSEFTSVGENLRWTTRAGDVLRQARLGYGDVDGYGSTLRLVLEQYVAGARTDVAHVAVFLD